jgi:hypothetical protein
MAQNAQAFEWVGSLFTRLLNPYEACCCSHESHGKGGEMVIMSEWDAKNGAPLGFSGSLNAPAAAQLEAHGASAYCQMDEAPDEIDRGAYEAIALREMMKCFVQETVAGKAVEMVVQDGRSDAGTLKLTPNLQFFQLETCGVIHDIPLRSVRDVCPGKLADSGSAPVKPDELCSTVVLKNGECVTFRLRDDAERDRFTRCVKVLSMALDL